MGRKNLSNERKEQILDAFQSCVAKHGLEASTLDVIAEEAGVKRSLIRHYLGNRDEVLAALIERMIKCEHSKIASADSWNIFTRKQIVCGLLDELFEPPSESEAYILELFKGLWISSATSALTRSHLKRLYREYFRGIEVALRHAYPKAKKPIIRKCAYALLCLSDGHSSMEIIGIGSRSSKSVRSAAKQLIDQLEGRS